MRALVCIRRAPRRWPRSRDRPRGRPLRAAFLHDIGIYPSRTHGGVYTDESGEIAERLFTEAGANSERARLRVNACAYHHARSSQIERGAEVELLRLADQIEVSGGMRRHGLRRDEIQDTFDAAPRDGLYGHIAKLTVRALRDRPRTLPKIFKRWPGFKSGTDG